MNPEELDELSKNLVNLVTTGWEGDSPEEDVKAQRLQWLEATLASVRRCSSQGSSHSASVDDALQKCATLSRNPSWRAPLGASGFLDFALGHLAEPGLRGSFKVQTLRLVGNSCADTDENRARVVQGKHIPSIIGLLGDDDLLPFVVPSLYNICVDYEPAQLQASEAGLGEAYLALLESSRAAKFPHLIGVIGNTFGLLAALERERDSASSKIPTSLLRLVSSPAWPTADDPLEQDAFCGFASAAVSYLSNERLLADTVAEAPVVFRTLDAACNRFHATEIDDDDEAGELKTLRKGLVGIIADLTALPDFASRHPAGSDDEMSRMLRESWLSKHHSPLQEAACLVLGNLAFSDESSTRLVQQSRVHEPLVDLLAHHYPYQPGPDDTVPSALLHAAIGLLKNLAIPAANKPILGPLLLEPAPDQEQESGDVDSRSALLARLWASADTQPQTQLAVVSLTRLLLGGTPSNAALLCNPLSADPEGNSAPGTTVHALAELFARADPEPTKTEAARAALALCRLLHTTPVADILRSSAWGAADEETSGRRPRFYAAHEALGDLLAFLVLQKRFPALRSEAWFVFSLMSRSADGASLVVRVLTATPANAEEPLKILGEAVGVDDDNKPPATTAEEQPPEEELAEGLGLEAPRQAVDPKQAANMAKVDRENALVLITELLRNKPEGLSEEHMRRLERLLREGQRALITDRGVGPVDGQV